MEEKGQCHDHLMPMTISQYGSTIIPRNGAADKVPPLTYYIYTECHKILPQNIPKKEVQKQGVIALFP